MVELNDLIGVPFVNRGRDINVGFDCYGLVNLFSVGNGKFELTGYSADGANVYTLTHDNNGNLNWRGNALAWKKDYLPLAGGTMTGNITWNKEDVRLNRANENGQIQFYGGIGWNTSASLILYGNKDGTNGDFNLSAHDGTTRKQLIGKSNGVLTWDGKDIEIVSAKNFGNQSYIRYKSGIQICYGTAGGMTASGITVTFAQPFLAAPVPLFSCSNTAVPYTYALTATDMTIKTSDNTGYIRYMAIGRWQ